MDKIISLLLPTKGRPEMANAFIKSVEEAADNISRIEIVVCTDIDDITAESIQSESVQLVRVSIEPGSTMGQLNLKCFERSSGKYVMLVNDDIIVHTKGWDTSVIAAFESVGDDIALVHVNDLLFGKSLCTFPMQSRKAINIIGLCDPGFIRYRIDDHCYDTYAMMAEVGYKRIIYLPDVVFEHLNHYASCDSSEASEYFSGYSGKLYIPDQQKMAHDSKLFESLLSARKDNAVKLIKEIGGEQNVVSEIEKISNSNSCRKEENVIELRGHEFLSATNNNYSVTVLIVTSDLQRVHATECIRRVKQYTKNYDLIILDNNNGRIFNHPREMNKALSVARTDYVVLLDDDVFVEESWLEGLVRAIAPDVALVAPLHKDAAGYLSFAGIRLIDEEGRHEHILRRPDRPVATQALCSACLLIDMKKMAGIRVNENNQKYFLDIDFSLAAWERGYKCVVTPDVCVVHLGGATLEYGTLKNKLLWEKDQNVFKQDWTVSGRLKSLYDGIWRVQPDIIESQVAVSKPMDGYETLATLEVFSVLLLRENIRGFNILKVGDFYFAVLQRQGEVTRERLLSRDMEPLFWGKSETDVIVNVYETSMFQIAFLYILKKIKNFLKRYL